VVRALLTIGECARQFNISVPLGRIGVFEVGGNPFFQLLTVVLLRIGVHPVK